MSAITFDSVVQKAAEAWTSIENVFNNVAYQYPITLTAAFLVEATIVTIFPSIIGIMTLVFSTCLIFPQRKHLYQLIKLYQENDILEWTASFDAKENYIARVVGLQHLQNSLAGIIGFTKNTSNWIANLT